MSYFISVYAVMALQTCAIGSVLAADEAGWAAAGESGAGSVSGGRRRKWEHVACAAEARHWSPKAKPIPLSHVANCLAYLPACSSLLDAQACRPHRKDSFFCGRSVFVRQSKRYQRTEKGHLFTCNQLVMLRRFATLAVRNEKGSAAT